MATLAIAGTLRSTARTKVANVILAVKSAPIRVLAWDKGKTQIGGFTTNLRAKWRQLPARLTMNQIFVWSNASPLRIFPRDRSILGMTIAGSAALATRLRVVERTRGLELTTAFSTSEIAGGFPFLKGVLGQSAPTKALVGTERVVGTRLVGRAQSAGFTTPLAARGRGTASRLKGSTAPSTNITPTSSALAGISPEWEVLIGFRSRIAILRQRYVYLGPPGGDPRYPPTPVGVPGSRYPVTPADSPGERYPPLPTFDDPSLE